VKMADPEKNQRTLVIAAIICAACLSLYLIYYHLMPACGAILAYLIPIIAPFLVALIISILVEPLVAFFSRMKMPRGWAVLTTLLLVIGALSSVLALISIRLFLELQKLSQNIPDMTLFFERLAAWAQAYYLRITLPPEALAQLQVLATRLGSSLTKGAGVAVNGMISFFTLLPGFLIMLIILLIATFFFCRDKDKLGRSLVAALPVRWRQPVSSVYLDFSQAVLGYFLAQVTLISLNTLLAIVGLYLIGVEYALLMGLVTGFFDMLPIFGPGTVFIPWAIYHLILGDYWLALGLIVLYGAMIVSRQIMEPKLVGQSIGVHPLATLAAIYAGLKVIGVLGIFIGPALLVLVQAIMKARNESLGR